jgi:hypothetical protein
MSDTDLELRIERAIRENGWCHGCENVSLYCKCAADDDMDESEASPAPCGYIPEDGWPNRWARDGHRDSCSACADVEARMRRVDELLR